MNLGDIRQQVWDVLEVDAEDLPPALIDASVDEGYERLMARSLRWPWLQGQWELPFDPGTQTVDLGSTGEVIREVAAMRVGASALVEMDEIDAANRFTSEGVPTAYSRWGDSLSLWPTPSEGGQLVVRGWRRHRPFEPLTGWEPDLPVELHSLLVDWALGNEYQRQEDLEMMQSYRVKWEDQVTHLKDRVLARMPATPLVVGSDAANIRGR